jgi:hypothetical protein
MARGITTDGKKPKEEYEIEKLVREMRRKSPVTQGKCALCPKEGKLLSGVCEECFVPWAIEAAKSQLRWRK